MRQNCNLDSESVDYARILRIRDDEVSRVAITWAHIDVTTTQRPIGRSGGQSRASPNSTAL